MRGRLERCVSKISDFSQISARQNDSSPTKSPGGRPRLTQEMIRKAKETEIDPETKIAHHAINEK